MTSTLRVSAAISICTVLAFSGCAGHQPVKTPTAQLTVEKVLVINDLDLPECLTLDPASGKIYISNVVTPNKGYWVDDNNGFISLMNPNGKIETLHWLASSSDMAINNPKGMCVLGDTLYFNDNDKLKRCPLNVPGRVGVISLPGAKKLNDLATDGKSIWATDTETGKVFCVAPDGTSRIIQGPASINGITCHQGKVFAVSWDLHEVYELDPAGKKAPEPFGLASYFTKLDAIEVLDNGMFIVSDYMGNKICAISEDRKTVTTLIELQSPADLGLDRKNNLLYVPEMLKNRATVLKLTLGPK
jgi:hypothetical protein